MKRTLVEKHFDDIASKYDYYKTKSRFYYDNLKNLLKSMIPSGKNVFEFGCGTGDLLYKVKPKSGYGMDISGKMIELATSKYKKETNLTFSTSWPKGDFDYIFMSDVIEHLENPKTVFMSISRLMNENSKFINTMMNPAWEPIERVYTWLGLKMPEGPHKRIVYSDAKALCDRAGLTIIKHDYKLLMPVKILFVTNFLNNYVEKYLKRLAFIEYFVAVKRNPKSNRQV